jgi:hypothetical protein
MYQEIVYYNRMNVKTRLSQPILSKIVEYCVNTKFSCITRHTELWKHNNTPQDHLVELN